MRVRYRTKSRFLFFPKTIKNKTKWLVFAEWRESKMLKRREPSLLNPFGVGSDYWTKWKPVMFIENETISN